MTTFLKSCILLSTVVSAVLISCSSDPVMQTYDLVQLTHDPSGHCINSTEIFSPDDQWIVYDSRLVDSGIGAAGEVAMVHTQTGEIRTLYRTENQTAYGPGVGAVTFSPFGDRVLFIHGIRNANQDKPYSMTRRTGVAVDINDPMKPIFLDARCIQPPFVPGALRGGTHAHTWSSDGWISYTYNDYLIEQEALKGAPVKDLRTIGIMVPGEKVVVPEDRDLENNSGEMFSLIVAKVTDDPQPGTDEVDKAFDECWIGTNGYLRADGTHQKRAIAYQGNIRDENGETKTEIFVVDIPDDIVERVKALEISTDPTVRLPVSEALISRRITQLERGVSPSPRHWLRATADGSKIGFLAEDDNGIVQFHTVTPLGDEVRQITNHPFSISAPFNFSKDGKRVAYLADHSVYITDIETGESNRVSPKYSGDELPTGAVVWSNDGKTLAFNRYIKADDGKMYLQIFLLKEQ